MLLDVWREVGRHTALSEAVERIARVLTREIPVRLLLVRRLDLERMRLEAAAGGRYLREAALPGQTRTELSPARLQALLEWGRSGAVLRGRAGAGDALLDTIVPGSVRGEVMAGPLRDGEQMIGVLLLVGEAGEMGVRHDPVVRQLLEPVSVALSNDLRLHELHRLREALEADKQALLTRLGRQEISEAIVGSEAGLRSVLSRVAQVAPTDAPVLILGETGSGKEVLAREIHRRSARASGPVVRVNCGAIPAGLIDSELFGHERGSFSGAVSEHVGWFERADGGTLFLDEIGELPLEAQVRLLRVLQDGTFERVGGRRTRAVDVRIVAATHRDLHAMVRDRAFREDLWYRISVFPVHLPPLRERKVDIPALARHFAARSGMRLAGVPLAPSAHDLELLLAYPWPGNVRELAAVLERAAILGSGLRLEVAAALGGTGPLQAPASLSAPEREAADLPPQGRFPTLDEAAARHIERALAATGGRIEGRFGAAALLGVNPHTLRSRMRRLGVDWRGFRGASAAPDVLAPPSAPT